MGIRPLQPMEDGITLDHTDTIEENEYPDYFRLSAILVALVFSIFLASPSPILTIIGSFSNTKLQGIT
jgi:hypothetical protein